MRVVEEGNWTARAVSGSFSPIGVLWHHTAATSSASNPAPSLNVVINGRPDLQGPLCHALVDYNGVFHIISGGRANHAGASGGSGPIPVGDGNTMLIGWEIDYNGVNQSMTSAQYSASVTATAAVLDQLGRDASYARGHRETSTTGKIDPSFIDLDKMRSDVARTLAGGGVGRVGSVVSAVSRGGRYDVFVRAADDRLL
ncbi:peptidoglycan recognition protein family protein, partial [Flindersiella endophytica]